MTGTYLIISLDSWHDQINFWKWHLNLNSLNPIYNLSQTDPHSVIQIIACENYNGTTDIPIRLRVLKNYKLINDFEFELNSITLQKTSDFVNKDVEINGGV